jgi:signal transduction histidine kinase
VNRLSLRVYVITLFIITVLVVTGLSTAFGVRQASDGIRDSLVARQRDAGIGAANNILYLFDSGQRSLTSAASLISAGDLRTPREDTIGPLLDPLVAFSREFSSALLVDSAGKVVIARPPSPQFANATFAGEPTLKIAESTTAAQLALPGSPRRPFWTVRIPATYDSAKPYYLIGVMNTNLIENILFNNIEPRDQAVLLNADHLVIAATEPTIRPDAFSTWEPLTRLGGESAGVEEGNTPTNDQPVLVTASSLKPHYPATVALMSPKSQITNVQSQLVRSAIFTGVGLALTAIVLGVFATNFITRPLDDVRRATRRMSGGDLTVRARPRGARELQDLANDFNSMAQTLSTEWEQRVQLQNHLEEKVAQRTEELEAKRQEMELFFYGVSHDFKSPVISISNIIAMAEETLQEKDPNRAALLDMIQRVRRSSGALSKLTNELLQFAQAERAAPKYATVQADQLLRTIADEFKIVARERGIRLETEGRVGRIVTDPDRLRHVVANLLDNAIKYMPEKKAARVRLEWRRSRNQLELSVHDNGLGIPAQLQKTLFRPFMRHDPSGAAVSGAGLGLSIVKRMTESLKGTVQLDTAPGRGSTFRLRIPIPSEADA